VCETLALDEELAAEFVEALGAALGAGLGAGLGAALGGGLGGGLLGALGSWCCAKTTEDNSRIAARERLESRIKHLVPTEPYPSNRGWGASIFLGRFTVQEKHTPQSCNRA
jgi:hypothetical protein